ncbi:hypothetical protein PG994_004598 [Apiospora phragmitis]|uniref:Uncharacterized protein n=1 Tax=Apiospora phragmitis TaxID=2905665 RepID=A0ABR1VUX0_9PEZI
MISTCHLLTIHKQKCRAVLSKSNGGELMASHDFKEWAAGAVPVATVTRTVMHNGPLHDKHLMVRFACGFKYNRSCDDGGSEALMIGDKKAAWAGKPERMCNWGKQSIEKKEKCEKKKQ